MNRKGCGIKTVVRGIRATDEFWEICQEVAERENTTRNELIVKVLNKYIKRKYKK